MRIFRFFIIIGRTALFRATVFLTRFFQIASGLHVFRFRNNFILQSVFVSLAFNSRPGGSGLCIYVPKLQSDPFLTQEPGSISPPSTTRNGSVEVFYLTSTPG
jgi:hypothetical protein